MTDFTKRVSELRWLHPKALPRFEELRAILERKFVTHEIDVLFLPFETYRTPQRQQSLLTSVGKVTQAGPFKSAHQLGLAVDFVPIDAEGKWSWDDTMPWNFLDECAAEAGLVRPIKWDRAHIEHPEAGHMLRELNLIGTTSRVTKFGEVLAGWDDEAGNDNFPGLA